MDNPEHPVVWDTTIIYKDNIPSTRSWLARYSLVLQYPAFKDVTEESLTGTPTVALPVLFLFLKAVVARLKRWYKDDFGWFYALWLVLLLTSHHKYCIYGCFSSCFRFRSEDLRLDYGFGNIATIPQTSIFYGGGGRKWSGSGPVYWLQLFDGPDDLGHVA